MPDGVPDVRKLVVYSAAKGNSPEERYVMNSLSIKACALLIVFALVAVAAPAADPNNPTGTAGLIMIDKRGELVRFFDPSTLKEVAPAEMS